MSLAVLPFNAAEGTSPALGRQLAAFLSDSLTQFTGLEIQKVSFLTPIEQDGQTRAMFINITELMDPNQVRELFQQTSADQVMDGLIKVDGDAIDLTMRFHERENPDAISTEEFRFTIPELLTTIQTLIRRMAEKTGQTLPDDFEAQMQLGTENPRTFLKFLEGYDSIAYIQGSNGAVNREFSPQPAFDLFLQALEEDEDFLGPYEGAIQLARACGQFRIGTLEQVEAVLKQLHEKFPDDFRASFALGEIYQNIGNASGAAEQYERAIGIAPKEASLYLRLAMAQGAMGMPVNAERNLKKALELDPDLFEARDHLAAVLIQQGRAHEAPALWKEFVEKHDQHAPAWVKLAMAQYAAGDEAAAEATYERALELQDNLFVKRFYAPVLAQKGEYDRAMDFYEDCLEATPDDVPLLLEYARTLQAADREFEVPEQLKKVLSLQIDPDTRAQTMAWLIELEQPKRVEVVEKARQRMEQGEVESALRDLRPLKNWLGDYWKLWAVLSSGLNRIGQHQEAEEAATNLLNLFPGCEPGYGELMEALSKQGKTEDAYNLMRFAAQRMPQSLGIHLNLALAARRAGKIEEARHLAQQLREAIGPNEELEAVFAEIEA
jgi:tetratricopeptide (TPR) repeat protein